LLQQCLKATVRTSRAWSLIALTLALLGCLPTSSSEASTTCRRPTSRRGPEVVSVKASGVPCWHVTHDQAEADGDCFNLVECVDRQRYLQGAVHVISPTEAAELPRGEVHAFPPSHFDVTVQWMPCLIPGVYRGGCGHIRPVPEPWSCAASYEIIPSEEPAWAEWVEVVCRRHAATARIRLSE
jgi:hypothetical protein